MATFFKQFSSVILLLLVVLTTLAHAEKAIKISNCHFKLHDGSIIDLSSLDNSNIPFVDTQDDNSYSYKFNPCTPIKCKGESNTAICQIDKSQNQYNLGNQQTSEYDDVDGSITYTGLARQSKVVCECSQDVSSFAFVNENPVLTYNFILKSPCCCKNGCFDKTVEQIGPCSALFKSGTKLIDLNELDNPSEPMFFSNGKYKYQFNPCSTLRCGPFDDDIAICKKSFDSKQFYNLGKQSSSRFFYDDSNDISIEFKSSSITSHLKCYCSEEEKFDFVKEPLETYFPFALYSKSCCLKDKVSTKLSNCKAQLADDSVVNLSSLDNPNEPNTTN